jgi:hypothetical protein
MGRLGALLPVSSPWHCPRHSESEGKTGSQGSRKEGAIFGRKGVDHLGDMWSLSFLYLKRPPWPGESLASQLQNCYWFVAVQERKQVRLTEQSSQESSLWAHGLLDQTWETVVLSRRLTYLSCGPLFLAPAPVVHSSWLLLLCSTLPGSCSCVPTSNSMLTSFFHYAMRPHGEG